MASRKPSPISERQHARPSRSPTAAPRGIRACCSSATNGFSSSAISPAMMNSSRIVARRRAGTGRRRRSPPAAAPSGPSAGRAPARRGPAARAWRAQRRGVRARLADVVERVRSLLLRVPRHLLAVAAASRRSSSSATSSGGPAGASCASCCPACARSSRSTSSSSTARTPPAGSGSRPRRPTSCSALGVDAITLGNHTYRHREIWPYLEEERRIVRPYNFLPTQPGRGTTIVERDGVTLGRRQPVRDGPPAGRPRRRWWRSTRRCARSPAADQILVDMHAEVTSEKVALGWYLDGKVTAVVGTHTHVPTADVARAARAAPPTSPTSA